MAGPGSSAPFDLAEQGYSGPALPEYSIGDIARADVLVRQDLVFKDEHASEAARAAAHDKVLPVYRYTREKSVARSAALAEAFQQCRALLQSSPEARRRPTRFSRLPTELQGILLEKMATVMVKPVANEVMD